MSRQLCAAVCSGILMLVGCTDQSTSPQVRENLTLSIASVSTMSVTGLSNGAVTIESAKILLKNIKFHQFPSDDGRDIKVGPLVVQLSLDGLLTTVAAAGVPGGEYDRVRFILHKPEDFEPIPDPEFREGESGSLRYSVIVRGRYEGTSFVYKSRENSAQEIRLAQPLAVSPDEVVNVTLIVDPTTWFVQNGIALDPTNPSNASAIDDAIRISFRAAFEDNNRDGRPDGSR